MRKPTWEDEQSIRVRIGDVVANGFGRRIAIRHRAAVKPDAAQAAEQLVLAPGDPAFVLLTDHGERVHLL